MTGVAVFSNGRLVVNAKYSILENGTEALHVLVGRREA